MSPYRGTARAGVQRAGAPEHRRAQGLLASEPTFAAPLVSTKTRQIGLAFGNGLAVVGDQLQVRVSPGLRFHNGAVALDVGRGLELAGGKLRVATTTRVNKLASEDGFSASGGYTQGEAQATMDKCDEIINVLRTAGIMKDFTEARGATRP